MGTGAVDIGVESITFASAVVVDSDKGVAAAVESEDGEYSNLEFIKFICIQ